MQAKRSPTPEHLSTLSWSISLTGRRPQSRFALMTGAGSTSTRLLSAAVPLPQRSVAPEYGRPSRYAEKSENSLRMRTAGSWRKLFSLGNDQGIENSHVFQTALGRRKICGLFASRKLSLTNCYIISRILTN